MGTDAAAEESTLLEALNKYSTTEKLAKFFALLKNCFRIFDVLNSLLVRDFALGARCNPDFSNCRESFIRWMKSPRGVSFLSYLSNEAPSNTFNNFVVKLLKDLNKDLLKGSILFRVDIIYVYHGSYS